MTQNNSDDHQESTQGIKIFESPTDYIIDDNFAFAQSQSPTRPPVMHSSLITPNEFQDQDSNKVYYPKDDTDQLQENQMAKTEEAIDQLHTEA